MSSKRFPPCLLIIVTVLLFLSACSVDRKRRLEIGAEGEATDGAPAAGSSGPEPEPRPRGGIRMRTERAASSHALPDGYPEDANRPFSK